MCVYTILRSKTHLQYCVRTTTINCSQNIFSKTRYRITEVFGGLIQKLIILNSYVLFKQEQKNSSRKHVRQGWNTQAEIDIGNYYRV